MPYIATKTNVKITKEQKANIIREYGKAIEFIPGKSESVLMLHFEDECDLYFRGVNDLGIAMVEVKSFGKASSDVYDKLTDAITGVIHDELGIEPINMFVKYDELTHWGKNHDI
jgi:phenylpyruvate tautomerase PptA (4-oxalocrotonate tautomerase family)